MQDKTYNLSTGATRVRFIPKNAALDGADKPHTIVIFDKNTKPLFNAECANPVTLVPGERRKRWRSVQNILGHAVDAELGRDGVFMGVGGGVLCDMTAFAASVYMRGCEVVLVPTTLLAMIDASVGGKTGIDFRGFKNLIGTFHPAVEVRICTELLKSLPAREYKSGLSEAIKHAFLGDERLLEILETRIDQINGREQSILSELVSRSIDVKGAIVEQDAKETGIRAHLNFGHTFAHALESATGFRKWTHGEAVAWGMEKALRLGVSIGVTDPSYAERARKLLLSYGYDVETVPVSADTLLDAMRQDKKKRGGQPQFVLQKDFGETVVQKVELEDVRAVLL